jgi:uncharacterized protein (DUF58 family)
VRRRSSGAVGLGLAALVASWAFGSTPLVVVGLGLVAAGIFARLWARAAEGSMKFERKLLAGERIEGDDLAVEIRARHRRRLLGGSIVLRQRLGPLEQAVRMQRSRTVVAFESLPRGRHRLAPLHITMTDPLGLARVDEEVDDEATVLIRPRIPTLTSIFSTRGARDAGAARSRLRRPTGFEIHAVRDYAPGEPLRAVHWPSTARRGKLMVKELDDAPRDDLAIVLDQDADGVAGPVGRSSFDAAVRTAGALALAHVLWNRRVVLVGTAAETDDVRVRAAGHDWELALDSLATVEPVADARVDRVLRSPSAAISRAREIVVVTARPDRAVEPLLELRRGGRSVSLVIVASETYAGRARGPQQPAALRAAAQGVPVAVISAETPIAEALAGRSAGAASG